MLDIGFQELIVVMLIALLVFGPYKLPELGRALGRAMREFRRASDEFRSTIETNLNINEESILPPSAPTTPAASTADGSPTTGFGDDAEPTVGAMGSGDSTLGGLPGGSEPTGSGPGGVSVELVDPFCSQRGGRLLHRSSCGWVSRIQESERIAWKTVGEAAELGLVSCPVCSPVDSSPASVEG